MRKSRQSPTAPSAAPAAAPSPSASDNAAALVVDGEFDNNFAMSARNINHVSLLPAKGLNVYDIMRSEKLVLTKAALAAIEARLA